MKTDWRMVGIIVAGVIVLGLWAYGLYETYAVKDDSTFTGYYRGGFVGIKVWKTDGYTEYKMVSDHEYGHHIYQKLSWADKQEWKRIVLSCGFESKYAQTYRSLSLRLEEEYADTFMNTQNNITVCGLKKQFVVRWTR